MTPAVMIAALAAATVMLTAPPSDAFDAAHPPTPQAIAKDVWLIPGEVPLDREPDGNTLVIAAPRGLIVFDTGRHAWHLAAIERLVAERRAPVAAIVNSHWHLDHVSGNPALKRQWPAARVYASGAIRDALPGFLAHNAAEDRQYLASGKLDPAQAEDARADVATIEAGAALIPDVTIDASERRVLAGRKVDVNLAPNAATAGDVCQYDPASRAVAAGDLVTLPAPFLDTACPAGWSAALARIAATPFRVLIPGHGQPMTRTQFALYRHAFTAVIDCANGARPAADCAADWARDTEPLLDPGPAVRRQAQGLTEYYVKDVLRAHGGKSAYCAVA